MRGALASWNSASRQFSVRVMQTSADAFQTHRRAFEGLNLQQEQQNPHSSDGDSDADDQIKMAREQAGDGPSSSGRKQVAGRESGLSFLTIRGYVDEVDDVRQCLIDILGFSPLNTCFQSVFPSQKRCVFRLYPRGPLNYSFHV